MGVFHFLLSFAYVYNDSPMKEPIKRANKILAVAFLSLLFRLIPVRVPNIEPILASMMPISGSYGAGAGFFFALISVLLYDVITRTVGVHTIFTLFAFCALGIWSASYFKSKVMSTRYLVRFAIIGTLFFDAITGLIPGPLLFGQPFLSAFLGQIPFTALHLLGNVTFAVTLSPAIHYLLVRKRKRKEQEQIISIINPKTI
jgi:hypothetical protein